MSAALSLQKALRARLAADPGVLALVPAANIQDRHGAPTAFPAIHLGEDLEVASDLTWDRKHVDVFLTLHIWSREPGTTGAKAIAGAIRKAIRHGFVLDGSDRLVDLRFEAARFMRDPDGVTAHGVVTLEATVEEGLL